MKIEDQKDIVNSEIVDIAVGIVTTAFVFKRKDGTLHGFKIPTDKIEVCSFTKND